MRLEHLCDIELRFRDEKYLKPYGEHEIEAHVPFDGPVEGPGLRGTLRGTDYIRMRGDGTWEVHVHGEIATGDGAAVLVRMGGLCVPAGEGKGWTLVMPTTFAAQDERYRRLNRIVAVAEGFIPPDGKGASLRVFGCEAEMRAP